MSASLAEGQGGELRALLLGRFGARCRLDEPGLRLYGYDAMGTEFAVPGAVVQVTSAEEAAVVLEIARRTGRSLVARGSGTGLSGGSVPAAGAIVLSFERMRGVQDLHPEERTLRAQPGVVNGSLERLLAPHGLFYPPDPASYRVSSIGGNVAENAGGPHAVKYGVTGQHLRALHVVATDGSMGWLHAGAVQPGPDLVALVTGSEGTLCLVTEAELSLERRPAEIATVLLSFKDIAGATDYVSAAVAGGLLPATLEFLDRATIEAVEAWGAAGYPAEAGAVLLMEIDGSADDVADGLRLAQELAAQGGALAFQTAQDPAARDALWYGRRGAYAAVARHGRRVLTQDVTVPRELLTQMLQEVEEIARRHGLLVATHGHAGDGNLHPDFPYDPADPEESAHVHRANDEVIEACVRLGGSITGEHGIGIEKLHHMAVMYGPAELGLMWAVRRALDPQAVLNPGKAVPEAPRAAADVLPKASAAPQSPEELQAAVLFARARGEAVMASLGGLRGIRIERGNLTAEVGAGETPQALSAALADSPLSFAVSPMRSRTLGEALLCNDYGPEHLGSGTLRNHLLAVTYVTGAGELVRMGRSVVKNVAGYDLYRLLIGSRGRLGLPVSLTLRVAPRRGLPYWQAQGDLGELRGQARPAAKALFALPEGGGHRVFAQFSAAPGDGWEPAPEAPQLLSDLRARLSGEPQLLDLALAPKALSGALERLGAATLAVLPAAARIFAVTSGAEARDLVRELSGEGPVRADLGGRRLEVPGDGVARDWEDRLRAVFDPDGVLRDIAPWEGEES